MLLLSLVSALCTPFKLQMAGSSPMHAGSAGQCAAVVLRSNPVHLLHAPNGRVQLETCWTYISGLLRSPLALTMLTPAEARIAGSPAEQQQQPHPNFEFQSSGARCSKPGCHAGRLLCMHDRQATAARAAGACKAAGCPEACRGEPRSRVILLSGRMKQITTLFMPGRPVRSTWLAACQQIALLAGAVADRLRHTSWPG